jgi:hypothetical protein
VVDKIPTLDHISDLVHLPIKPVVAVGLVLAVAAPEDVSSLGDLAIPLAIAAALVALLAHLGKAGLRAGSTAATGGLANPLLSVVEDLGVVGLIVAAVLVPLLALVLAALALGLAARGVTKWVRRARAGRTEASPT